MTTLDLNPTAPRPVEETQPLVDRTLTNPMFNDQKMKLGLFGTNCSYGLTMSHAPSSYVATWEHTLEIAQRAEALGFEALVPIDHISLGRFVLNLVMGWFSPEMDMFHGRQLEHDERYAFGQEWLDLVRRLWSEPGSFDFHGKFFQG